MNNRAAHPVIPSKLPAQPEGEVEMIREEEEDGPPSEIISKEEEMGFEECVKFDLPAVEKQESLEYYFGR